MQVGGFGGLRAATLSIRKFATFDILLTALKYILTWVKFTMAMMGLAVRPAA
jgi:hypothetical protein